MRHSKFMWTKQNLEKVIDLWDTKTPQEVADEIGTSKQQISAMAGRLRKMGFKLPQKRRRGYLESLLKEFAKEQKVTK